MANGMVVNIKVNGNLVDRYVVNSYRIDNPCRGLEDIKVIWNPGKLKQIAITLWISSGIITSTHVNAQESVWKQMKPVFGVFQDMAMVLGAIAIIVGLIIMIFRKNIGWRVASTAGLVILGCFLVPSLVMLVAIIGGSLNDILSSAFENMQMRNSVKVGG